MHKQEQTATEHQLEQHLQLAQQCRTWRNAVLGMYCDGKKRPPREKAALVRHLRSIDRFRSEMDARYHSLIREDDFRASGHRAGYPWYSETPN